VVNKDSGGDTWRVVLKTKLASFTPSSEPVGSIYRGDQGSYYNVSVALNQVPYSLSTQS
jgi:hypothetical protein